MRTVGPWTEIPAQASGPTSRRDRRIAEVPVPTSRKARLAADASVRTARRDRLITGRCTAAIILSATVSILLRASVPVTLLNGAALDDDLFLRLASNLREGKWLGSFDTMTLAKGPAYPMFIAFTHLIGVPLKVGEQATLLLAALALTGCLWCFGRRPVMATAAFVVIALEPDSFSAASSRVFRDGWYAALALMLVTTFFLAVHLAVRHGARRLPLLVAALSGLIGGLFWLCREEGAWILPSLLLIAVVPPCARLLAHRTEGGRPDLRSRRLWARAGGVVAVPAAAGAGALLVIGTVIVVNHQVYGVALVNDTSSGAIARAYADWADVEAGEVRPFVPISSAQRAAVYAVSPAARELQPYLENPKNHWLKAGCQSLNICDDFAGGWEIWALREAADSAGHFSSEVEAQRYFSRVSRQIIAACSGGRLSCRPRLPTSVEPLQHTHPSPLVGSVVRGLVFITLSPTVSDPPHATAPVPTALRESFAATVDGVPKTQSGADRQVREFEGNPVYPCLRALYLCLIPVLVGLGLWGWLGSMITRRGRGRGNGLGVLAAALIIGVITRLSVLAVFDTTSFSTVTSPGYQMATRLLLLAFGVVGTTQLVDLRAARRRSDSPIAGTPPGAHRAPDLGPERILALGVGVPSRGRHA